jgi:REP element-mobilizing transposase RayT
MPRQLRIEYNGAIYHVMSRGDRHEKIFLDDVDRQDFLKTLAETCQKTGFLVHAYCLMPNHFHVVVETPEANLVAGMSWLLSTYTIRFNQRHKLSGHLFSGRYKALVVEGSGAGYLKTVCDYVHLNPVRANLLATEEKLTGYPWSSLLWYGAARQHRPAWLGVARLLGEHGLPEDSARSREAFLARMEARRWEEEDEEPLAPIRRGWCLGSAAFRQELLAKLDGQTGEWASGQLRQEHAESRAERIIAEELSRLDWTEEELGRVRKSAPEKMVIAARLRRETTVTLKWIAARLCLGTSKSANARVHQWMKNNPTPASSAPPNQPSPKFLNQKRAQGKKHTAPLARPRKRKSRSPS